MISRILLLALSAAAFSSCTSAYKSGQTPDDVYYSPVRQVDQTSQDDRKENRNPNNDDISIRMGTRDYRWRVLDDSYRYDFSPYQYCYSNMINYGYYYNPFYHPWPVYTVTPQRNTTPRMVNLGSYTGMNNTASSNPKKGNGINWIQPTGNYNNSNRPGIGMIFRQVVPPNPSYNSGNNTRTYTPSTNSSNSGSNGSGHVSRPGRGG